MSEKYQIAIDGPSGVGKSTIAKIIAQNLNFIHLNTGLLFRAVAYCYANRPQGQQLKDLLASLPPQKSLQYLANQIIYQYQDITLQLKTQEITALSSELAQISLVRNYVLAWERLIASNNNIVIEGRDIGTVVFPHAFLKIFLTASNQVRAKRRYQELKKLNLLNNETLTSIQQSFFLRDQQDQNRPLAPLLKAEDAYEINTDQLDISQVVWEVEKLFLEKLKTTKQDLLWGKGQF